MDLLPGAMDRMQERLFEGLIAAYAQEWMKARLLEAIGCPDPGPYPGRETDEALMAEVLAMEDE